MLLLCGCSGCVIISLRNFRKLPGLVRIQQADITVCWALHLVCGREDFLPAAFAMFSHPSAYREEKDTPPPHPSAPCSLGRGHWSSSPGWEGTAVRLHPLPEVVPLAVRPWDTASCSGRALLCVVAWAASPDGPSSRLHSRQAATAHMELPQPQPSPVPSLPWPSGAENALDVAG